MDINLTEIKIRLGMSLDDVSQDAKLTLEVADAIDYAQRYCNNEFAEGIPMRGIVLIIKGMRESSNVASQSLGDMSKSFFKDGTMDSANRFLRPYKRLKFV